MAIKAVIFDYYGVLLQNTHGVRLNKLRQDEPEKAEEFSAVNRAADRGVLSMEESRRRMAELFGISYEDLLAEYAAGETPNEPLITFIEQNLKSRYKLGLLSNSTSRSQLELRFAPGRLGSIFDEIVSSGEIGIIKPQPEIYHYIAAKLGVLPEECLMIDDTESFCVGAQDAGMEAVYFESTAQATADILKILNY